MRMGQDIAVFKVLNYVHLHDLKVHPQNDQLRTISPRQWNALKASILTRGFFEPLHVWAKDGTVLAGNHRLLVARELVKDGHVFRSPVGDNCLPVVVHEVDEIEAMSILFQTNNQYAEWIDDGLRAALREFEEGGGEVQLLGFSEGQVNALLGRALREADRVLGAVDTAKLKEDAAREIAPVTPDALDAVRARVERTEESLKEVALWLDPGVHEQLTGVLAQVAKKLNPRWREGDSLNEATGALVQLWRERDLLEEVEV